MSKLKILYLIVFIFTRLNFFSQDSLKKYYLENLVECNNYNYTKLNQMFLETFDSVKVIKFRKMKSKLYLSIVLDSTGKLIEINKYKLINFRKSDFRLFYRKIKNKQFYLCNPDQYISSRDYLNYFNNRFIFGFNLNLSN